MIFVNNKFNNFVNKILINVIDFCMEKGLIASKYECPECGYEMKLMERKGKFHRFQWRYIRIKVAKRHFVNRS